MKYLVKGFLVIFGYNRPNFGLGLFPNMFQNILTQTSTFCFGYIAVYCFLRLFSGVGGWLENMILTLLNAGYFYNYLTWRGGGGRNHPPLKVTQKSGFKDKSLLDPKIQASIRQQEKNWGRSAQYWARTDEIKISPKMSNLDIVENREF